MLKRSLKRCVDWSQIDKNEYLSAVRESVFDSTHIKSLVIPTLTTKNHDREMISKGIKVSHYYEELSRTYTIQKYQIEVWHKIEQL